MQPLEHDPSRDEIACVRDGFAEKAQNGQRFLVGSAHRRSTQSGCWRFFDGGGMEGVGHGSRAWPQAWIGCGLGRPAGPAVNILKCPGRCTRCQGRKWERRRAEVGAKDQVRNLRLSGVVTDYNAPLNSLLCLEWNTLFTHVSDLFTSRCYKHLWECLRSSLTR